GDGGGQGLDRRGGGMGGRGGKGGPMGRTTAAGVAAEKFFVNPATVWRRHYTLLGTTVSVGFTDKRCEESVHPTLRHLEVAASRSAKVFIQVVTSPQHYEIRCNGRRLGTCVSLSGVASLVNAQLFHLAIKRFPHVMALHSGAVASPHGCLLLPATSGSGKSTLTAALVRAGWRYMADDIVLLQHGSLNAVGVPNALGLKAGAWPVLESRYPELTTVAVHERSDGRRLRHVVPPGWVYPEAIESLAVRWIVFPRYGSGGSTEMCPLGTADGLCRLM